jgi:hypothetical protein
MDVQHVAFHGTSAIHSQKLSLFEIMGGAVILIERPLAVIAHVYAQSQRDGQRLHRALS